MFVTSAVLITVACAVLFFIVHNIHAYCWRQRRYKSFYISSFYFFCILIVLTDLLWHIVQMTSAIAYHNVINYVDGLTSW